jgi:hypothetical protein
MKIDVPDTVRGELGPRTMNGPSTGSPNGVSESAKRTGRTGGNPILVTMTGDLSINLERRSLTLKGGACYHFF